mmetsp:Transcript_10461/g.33117  ORF Transcript_10461/g.33117 Transcript_10461/m.33117 type:complete len:302 (+) Transcript_10461:1303-2208(+)
MRRTSSLLSPVSRCLVGGRKGLSTVTILRLSVCADTSPSRKAMVAYERRRCCARSSLASSFEASAHTHVATSMGMESAPATSATLSPSTGAALAESLCCDAFSRDRASASRQKEPSPASRLEVCEEAAAQQRSRVSEVGRGWPRWPEVCEDTCARGVACVREEEEGPRLKARPGGAKKRGSSQMRASPRSAARCAALFCASLPSHGASSFVKKKTRLRAPGFGLACANSIEICHRTDSITRVSPPSSMCPNSERSPAATFCIFSMTAACGSAIGSRTNVWSKDWSPSCADFSRVPKSITPT